MKRIISILCIASLILLCTAVPALAGTLPEFPSASSEYSAELAMAAVSVFGGGMYDLTSTKIGFASLGLETVAQIHYDKDPTDISDTSAFTIGTGTAVVGGEEKELICVYIRGTSGMEWISNFNFAPMTFGIGTPYAENFYAAAEDVYSYLKPVIDEHPEAVVFVTGYSRGAAVANLLGVILDDAYGEDGIYVYTAATPATVLYGKDAYGNIFNIVNKDDIVPSLPPEAWGFHRAGTDIVLSISEDSGSQWNEFFAALTTVCPTAESYYLEKHSLSGPGLSEDGISMCEFILSSIMSSAEASAMPGGSYADTEEMQGYMAMLANTDFAPLLPLLQSLSDQSTEGFFGMHMPNIYAALLSAM